MVGDSLLEASAAGVVDTATGGETTAKPSKGEAEREGEALALSEPETLEVEDAALEPEELGERGFGAAAAALELGEANVAAASAAAEAEVEALPLGVALAKVVAETLALALRLRVSLTLRLALRDSVALPLPLCCAEALLVGEALRDNVVLRVSEADGRIDGDASTLTLADADKE